MKLFYSQTSPFARKVLVLAHELGLAGSIELVEVNPWSDPALRAVNPLSQVPTLVLDDGTALYDSPVICDYVNEIGGGAGCPPSGPARFRALKLQAIGDGICTAGVRRVREGMRPPGEQHQDVLARQAEAIRAALDVLEGAAVEMDGFGVGEIALACALAYLDFRMPGDAWREGRPRLAAWYGVAAMRPSMQATQPPATPPR